MKSIRMTAVMCTVFILVGCHSTQFASTPLERAEADINEHEVPPAALEALRAAAAGRPFTAFEREDRGLYIAYEAEWQEGGVEAEATVLADGALLESEREMAPDEYASLPPAVLAKVRDLQERGFRVEVARRAIYLFDIDATPATSADPEDTAEQELLLRPDGSEAVQ